MTSWEAPRVAITREEELGGPLARALREAGLEPVACPALSTAAPRDPEPLRRAAAHLDEYDWLVAASARAVTALRAARGEALPARLRCAAVGEGTARALRDAGATSVLVGAGAGVAGLLPRLEDADTWNGRRVLAPRAEAGGRELAAALRGHGALVDEIVAYRTVARPDAEIVQAWRTARPIAAIFTSSSAAIAVAAAIGVDALRGLEAIVAIGPTTAATATRLGLYARVSDTTDFASVAERMRDALFEWPERRHAPTRVSR